MKKIQAKFIWKINKVGFMAILLLVLIFFITSCWIEEEKVKLVKSNKKEIQREEFIVWTWIKTTKKLEATIVSNNKQTISSSIPGTVSYLNCENWDTVYKGWLIAKITPDYNSVAYKNAYKQKSSLIEQLENTKNTKITTIENFDIQLSSLVSQEKSLKEQLESLESNLNNANSQKDLTSNNIQEQTKSKLEKWIDNLKEQLYNNIWLYNLYIDELYGITNENDDKNDDFENYLSAKDTAVKSQVISDFKLINKTDYKTLSNENFILFLEDFNKLLVNAYLGVNKSVESINFSSSTIQTYYSTILWYSNSILSSKSSLSSLLDDLEITDDNYENQTLTIDSSIWTIESQISSINNSITSVKNSIISLEDNRNIQINNLDNQILNLEQTIASLNTNMSSINLYSKTSWTVSQKLTNVWNNIWMNAKICEIIPTNWNNYKLRLFSSEKLEDNINIKVSKGEKHLFEFTKMTLLPSLDTKTQNYVYERVLTKNHWLSDNDKVDVVIFTPPSIPPLTGEGRKWYLVPLNYLIPKLSGDYVIVKIWSGELERKVETGRVDLPNIEVLSWLEKGEVLVK